MNKKRYLIMQKRLRYDIDLDWLMQFKDFDKLKFLNKSIMTHSNDRAYPSDTQWYISFIEKFYNDQYFNKIYNIYISTGDKLIKPSLDHIVPLSKGGTNDIDNLQFLTWFENNCKYDITNWEEVKQNIKYYFKGV